MRLHAILLGAVLLSGCGGSKPVAPQADEGPLIYRTVIEADGIPFEVSWDQKDRTRATARVFGDTGDGPIDVTTIMVQATGCQVSGIPTEVPAVDGVTTYLADVDCSPAKVQTQEELLQSRALAREIDLALNQLSAAAAAAPPEPAQSAVEPVAASEPSLFEGSPFSAFNATDIERYCAEPWETRVNPDGRTEYNPCKRRDAFR